MKILITGINGFVGKHLYHVLSVEHEIVGIYQSGDALFANSYKINLSNEEETKKTLEDAGIGTVDVIIHLASKTAGAHNIHDLSVLTANTAMAKTIAQVAKDHHAAHVINLSSSSVYSNTDGVYDENSVTDPSLNADCIYGLSKLNGEVIINYFLSGTNTVVTHLRTAIIYGSGMDRTRLLPVIEKEIQERNTVTLFGNGERLLNLISVGKLIDYISFFLVNPVKGIINVCEETISSLELAQRLISQQGNAQTKILLKPEGNRSRFTLDHSKLKKITANV